MWDRKLKIFLPLLICLIQNVSGSTRIDPLVDSKVGLIRGLRPTNGDYSMFMGIPYATVNASNPFGPSTPHPGFEETFEAYDDSAICPQVEEFNNTIVGTLDCLHLNIYVPNSANSRNTLPVLVWIHGGGFAFGFSGRYLYGPRYLMKQDVILVTFNYRLGPYGFMCLDRPDVPGNQGLKDQLLALKWIKNNIEAFGGDSNKITLFGESAGGVSVDFHLTYGQEKLFDKVIMQSGTILSPWSTVDPDLSAPLKLSEHLGFPTTDVENALTFLSTIDTNLMIATTSELGLNFVPCVEKDFDNVEKFIHDYPINIKELWLGNMPILLGINSDEGLVTYEAMTSEEIENLNLIYNSLEQFFTFDDEELIEMEELVRHFYIGDENIIEELKQGYIKFYTDFFFSYPVVQIIQKYLDNGARDLYYYLFSYDGKRNLSKHMNNITVEGASHADEIGYFFDISYMDDDTTPEDQLVIDRITTLWSNFAKFGNPTPGTTDLLPVQWPTVTKDTHYYLNIDSELSVEINSKFKSRIAFWELFYRLNEKTRLGYNESTASIDTK